MASAGTLFVSVRPSLEGFGTSLREQLNAEVPNDMHVRIVADADTGAARANIAALGAEADKVDGKKINIDTSGAFKNVSLLALAITGLGPALIPIAAVGAAAFGSMGIAAGIGAGAVASVVLAFKGIPEAVKAQAALTKAVQEYGAGSTQAATASKNLDAAMRGLSPAAQSFVTFYASTLKPVFAEMQAAAATGLLPGLQAGITSALPALTQLKTFIGTVSTAMGDLAREAGAALGGPFWRQFFDFVNSVAAPAVKTLGEAFGNLIKGAAGIMQALYTPVFVPIMNWFRDFAKAVADFGASAAAGTSSGFNAFLAYVKDNGPKVAELLGQLAKLLGTIVTGLAGQGAGTLTVLVDFLKVLNTLPPGVVLVLIDLFTAFKVFQLVAGPIAVVAQVLASLPAIIAAVRTAFVLLQVVLLENPFIAIAAAIVALAVVVYTNWGAISSFLSRTWDAIKGFAISIWNSIAGFFIGLWQTISGAFITAWNAITSFLSGIWNGIKNLATTVFTSIANFFTSIWNGISSFLSTVWNAISGVAHTVFNAILSYFSTLWDLHSEFIKRIWNDILSFLSTLWDNIKALAISVFTAIANFFTAIWTSVSNFFTTIWTAISNFAVSIWNTISSFFTSALNAFVSFWQGIWNNVFAFFEGIWNNISAFVQGVWNAIASFFAGVLAAFVGFWSGIWQSVYDFVAGIWNNISSFVQGVWNGIASFFTGALNTFTTFWSGVWDGVSKKFSDVWNGIKQTATDIWSSITGAVKAGINAVIGILNGIVHGINFVINGLGIDPIPDIPTLAVGGVLSLDVVTDLAGLPQLAGGGTVGPGFVTDGPVAIVGEGNPNHPEYVIPTDPIHRGRALALYDSLGAQLMDDGGIIGNIVNTLENSGVNFVDSIIGSGSALILKALDGLKSGFDSLFHPDDTFIEKMAHGGGDWIFSHLTKIVQAAVDAIKAAQAAQAAASSGGPSGPAPPGSVGDWINQALAILGYPASYGAGIAQQIKTESGGNPTANNLTDSNAQAGHPSKGIMQTIDSTFNAYALPGHTNIWNPIDNIIAASRYAMARYGAGWFSTGSQHSHGYDLGGVANLAGFIPKFTNDPERVLSPGQTLDFHRLVDWLATNKAPTGGMDFTGTRDGAAAVLVELRTLNKNLRRTGAGVTQNIYGQSNDAGEIARSALLHMRLA